MFLFLPGLKRCILLLSFIAMSSVIFAQSEKSNDINDLNREVLPVTIFSYTENFEESYYWDNYLGFNYDTVGIFNINVLGQDSLWAIGRPNKDIWDTSYLHVGCSPMALLTDTLNSYPINNHSIVEINIEKPTWAYYYKYCWSHMYCHMHLACDTDSLKDGVYFEISFDGGVSFTNLMDSIGILNANNAPDNIEMLSFQQQSFVCDTISGYSGIVHVQDSETNYLIPMGFLFSWEDENGFDVTESILRMHFVSDSIDTQDKVS